MKSLTLHCECGAVRTFRGADVNAVLEAIDDAGWMDYLDDESPHSRHGHAPAHCRKCLDRPASTATDPGCLNDARFG